EHVPAIAHVAGHRSAALAHAMHLRLLHVEPRAESRLRHNVRRLEHALPTQARDHDAGHSRHASYLLMSAAASRQFRRATITLSSGRTRLSVTSRASPCG